MWLTERVGDHAGRAVGVHGERFLVGRGEDCDLCIENSNVSRWHAQLAVQPDGSTELRDLGSANGTWVDGQRVERATLTGGQQLQFGDTVFTTSSEEPAEDRTDIRGAGGAAAATPGASSVRRALQENSAFQRTVRDHSALRHTIRRGSRRSVGVAAAVAGTTAAGMLVATGALSSTSVAERALQRVGGATVLVKAVAGSGATQGAGSGWVIDARRGLIVTNAHVINSGTRFQVGVDGRLREARVFSVAPCEDLALLQVEDTNGLRAANLGSQSDVRPGQTVAAVGFAGNASLEDQLTATEGIVSVAETTYRQPEADVPPYPNVIQTDAAVNPGNSGGPLVDAEGRVIGVNAAVRTVSAQGRAIQGQSYAIGAERVKEVFGTLRTGRSIGWAGLGLDYPEPEDLRRSRLPEGMFASRAVEGSPARRAGFGQESLLLAAVNGRRVGSTLAGYCTAVEGIASGATATFTVVGVRSGRARKVRVRFA